MKRFTVLDMKSPDRISVKREDLEYDPPQWMKRGMQETSSGYGARLNSGYNIMFEGRKRRIYITIYSNNGTAWFHFKGDKVIVSGF